MTGLYEYTAKDQTGRQCSGTYDDVASVAALREELGKMGYILVRARRRRKPAAKRKKVKQSEVVTFVYKFAEMYSAGLSIAKSLETLEQQTDNLSLRGVIADIRQNIETGSSLEKAFSKYTDIFSNFFVGMLEAGESGAKLGPALEMSAAYLEKRMDLRQKIRSAFAYPIMVCIVCLVVVGGLVGFVVPVFSKLYAQLHVRLPGPTQALVHLSYILRHHWWIIVLVVIGASILWRRLSKDPRIGARLDVVKLTMPVFGKLNHMVVMSHFTRTFAMLASVDVSLIRALEVASSVAHNHKLSEITKELQLEIEAGNSVGECFRKYDIFPPAITQLALSGEQVGELPQMLNRGADFLDKDIERTVHALIAKLEPLLTVIMGVVVAIILMAVYLPMFDYMRHLE
jgi:type IV pilus assembly protein PilC